MMRLVMLLVPLALLLGVPAPSWSQSAEALCGKWLGGTAEEAERWLACRKAAEAGRHPVQILVRERLRLIELEERRVRASEVAALAAWEHARAAEAAALAMIRQAEAAEVHARAALWQAATQAQAEARAAREQAERATRDAAMARRTFNCFQTKLGPHFSTVTCD